MGNGCADEAHDAGELESACQLRSPLMGINNRNLKTMEISLEVGKSMLPLLPEDRIAVAESGLFHASDLAGKWPQPVPDVF